MLILLSLFMIAGARAETFVHPADPTTLDGPIAERDPLVVLKRLWQAGARGPFFRLDHAEIDSAHYLLVDDWSSVGEIDSDSAILFRDGRLRELVGQISKIGTPVLVSSGRTTGGLAFRAGQIVQTALAEAVPRLRDRSPIALTARSSLYSLQHELAHHWDDELGFSEDLVTRLIPAMLSSVETQRQADLETAFAYIHEARAYRVQLASLKDASRPREWRADRTPEGEIVVREVDGAEWRREEYASALKAYNHNYARAFQSLPGLTRRRVSRIAKQSIPHYRRDFDRGLFRPCEAGLLEDLHGGRLMDAR